MADKKPMPKKSTHKPDAAKPVRRELDTDELDGVVGGSLNRISEPAPKKKKP